MKENIKNLNFFEKNVMNYFIILNINFNFYIKKLIIFYYKINYILISNYL